MRRPFEVFPHELQQLAWSGQRDPQRPTGGCGGNRRTAQARGHSARGQGITTRPEGGACTAKCEKGDVTCYGEGCTAQDGVGCSGDGHAITCDLALPIPIPPPPPQSGPTADRHPIFATTAVPATCTFKCGSGTISCTGEACGGEDGWGCWYTLPGTNISLIKPCFNGFPFPPFPFPE